VRNVADELVSTISWTSCPSNILASINPLGYSKEKDLVTAIIAELREKLALDLDSSPSFERGLVLQVKVQTTVDYLVIGGSNAMRLARALDGLGCSTCSVTKPGWWICNGNPELLAKSAIEGQEPGTTILQLLDNSIFYAKSTDGSWTLPTQDEKGVFHMKGEVIVAGRDTQMEHFKALKPLFDVLDQRKTLLLTPIPRYVTGGCCSDPDHMVNRADLEYKTKIMQDLDAMKRNLKDFMFRDGRRSMKLFNPNVDLRGLVEDDIWGDDPVHPHSSVYAKVAAGIVKMAGELPGKRRRTNSLEANVQPGSSRGRGSGQQAVSSRGTMRSRGWTSSGGRGDHPRGFLRGQSSDYWRPRGGSSHKRGRGYYY
jgi:hypothetical protein